MTSHIHRKMMSAVIVINDAYVYQKSKDQTERRVAIDGGMRDVGVQGGGFPTNAPFY